MKVCLAGHGAFGIKHLEAMSRIPDIEVVSLAGSNIESARDVVGSSRVDLQACKLEYSIVSPK